MFESIEEVRERLAEPCDMPLYEPICDRVEVVRTVEQLGGVAEGLVKARV